MIITCGVFIIDSQKKILCCHPTNAKSNIFSIPKGHFEMTDDSYLDRAIRETLEESNIDLNPYRKNIFYVGESIYKKKNKKLIAFGIIISDIFKNSFHLRCEKDFGILFPEVDGYKWFNKKTIIDNNLLHLTQIELLKTIKI
jgi:8-oxo-dGTP pyrophosphatase MutT (NUDIX family)